MKKALLLLCLVFGAFRLSVAQVQRLVLFEHFTQASCPPCAVYNPAINAMLDASLDKAVAIKYQTSWPGTDPMNAANPTDVATRVTYYGVSSVPNAVIDGNFYNGHPASVNQGMIDTRNAVPSPATVTAKYRMIEHTAPMNDSMAVHVKVKAVGTVPANLALHVVVIEREINFTSAPGTNGEKKFESVMKKMLPTASGTNLPAMAIGDSLEYDFKWSVTKANGQSVFYNPGQAALVAFVQNKSNKAILQATYDAPRPWLALALGEGVKQTRLKANNEISFPINAVSNTESNQSIFVKATATGLPTTWQMKLVIDGVELADTASFELAASQQKSISIKLSGDNTGFPNKKYVINLEANSKTINPTVKTTYKFTAFTPTNALLVDLVGGAGATRFTSAFAAAGQAYLTLSAEESEKLDATDLVFPNVKKLFYQVGDKASGTITTYNANMLDNYLESGGNLFVIGQDVGFDLFGTGGTNLVAQDFFKNRLGAIYVDDGSTASVGLEPAVTDPIFGSAFTGTLNLTSSNSPDQLAVNEDAPNADTVLLYTNINDDAVAAVRNNGDAGGWKCVYAGFRIETVNSGTWRNALIGTSMAWFDGTLTSNEFDKALKVIGNAYPNPANDQIFVPVKNQTGTIRIFDMSGKTVLSSPITGISEDVSKVNVASLKMGMYLLQVEQGGLKSDFQKITITK